MKIRIIAGGIYGGDGELPIGSEHIIGGNIPEGWAGKVEVVSDEPKGEPVTNPKRERK